jgi:carboxyvinyl-carboxyphosphonate phosphorylmutase
MTAAMTPTEKRQRLRAVLAGDRCVSPATVFDALSARIAEGEGFEFGILSGSVAAATLIASPDLALHTLTEFAEQVRRITRVTDLSLFVDADQGFGNALNARRTVEELEHAGVAGMALEDLVMPASFGSGGKVELISVAEGVGKLKAALSARSDPALVIVARTAALKAETIDVVVERVKAYEAAGVDGIFLTALKKLEDLDAVRAAVNIPIVIGSAPTLKREDLAARGVRFCLQGHMPVAGMVKALKFIYAHLHAGGLPSELKARLATPEEMAEVLGEAKFGEWQESYLN